MPQYAGQTVVLCFTIWQTKNLAVSVMGPLLARLRRNVSSLKMHFSLDLSFLQIGGVVGLLLRSYD